MTAHYEDDGNLRVAVSTWVFLLFVAGVQPQDDALAASCAAVAEATDAELGDVAGLALIERIGKMLADDIGVDALAMSLYGDRVSTGFSDGDRDARTHRVRAYQFSRGLPWLARIWERRSDGRVAPSWLLVERLTDQVLVMDPNPWNDIDEGRALPVQDFHVLWELDGCRSLHVV
ncbi:MAG: hypothetical protein ACI9MC_001093 [Kiritimatiellia bacterium]|jgi:hypothetical protein